MSTTKQHVIEYVDMCIPAEMTYLILDELYQGTMNDPLDIKDAIDYIEGRLLDHELPLTLEEYEEEVRYPTENVWKRINLFDPTETHTE